MEMTMVPTAFYDLAIFKGLARDEVDTIGRLANPRNFAKGDVLFQERNAANYLDIIWSGAVEIKKNDCDGEARVITVIQAPGVIGEMSLMSGQARSCTGTAISDVMLYRIRREDFMAEIDKGTLAAHKVVFNLAQLMSARLRSVDEKLVDLLNEKDEVTVEVRGSELSDFRKKLFNEWAF
ncbi:MAG: cyclic nucleotide-binding domain-containing protein [Candidatus Sericytochromatia bacterium]|nr:cyclic nucleotide-binding domain-containing protein [Candidatus Sericytochromatia bacterium]